MNGLHHVTAVSAQIGRNLDFYTRVLGLRLVKKSVNQDDTSAYHLFYADKIGSPGTDMTFFDWPHIGSEQRGTDSIVTTVFRVSSEEVLGYWAARLAAEGVKHTGIETIRQRQAIRFEDTEGQRLMLMNDSGATFEGEVWDGSDVPIAYAIRGFYAVILSVPDLANMTPIFSQALGLVETERFTYPAGQEVVVYDMGDGGPGAEVWVMEEPDKPRARLGAGGVHHVAFHVRDTEQQQTWLTQLRSRGFRVSAMIDRYYFKSIYFRISPGILFEIATDGPGFATDEDMDKLGEKLALPPFLESQRVAIEDKLTPIG